jgi:hypothetical protein
MVGGVCFLLLVSLTVENLLKAIHSYLQSTIPGGHYLALAVFYIFDLAILILLFAMLRRFFSLNHWRKKTAAWHAHESFTE